MSFRHALVLDFEATCDDTSRPRPQEIIEFPTVLVNLATLEPVAEFSEFVRPTHHAQLSDFCTELTSIRQEQVDAADTFTEVLERHGAWLTKHGATPDNALFVTCGDWDLNVMLPAQCECAAPPVEQIPPIFRRWCNIKRLFRRTKKGRASGMRSMLEDLGLPLQGHHHRGIDDCRNIAAILVELLRLGAAFEPTGELDLGE